MPELIIVSPNFPPVNTPDHQRVRQSLPWWHNLGWTVHVLAVDPAQLDAPQDPFLLELLPPEVEVERVCGLGLAWSRIPGFCSSGYRALKSIFRALVRVIGARNYTKEIVVYFSTTQFPVHVLIPTLKKKFPGITVVMDYQDPWVNDYYAEHPEITPPGGRLKYRLSSMLDAFFEPRVLRHIDGMTTVSPDYRRVLCQRYPWFSATPWQELPFGGASGDFERISKLEVEQTLFQPGDGNLHWVYVGRAGPYMETAVRSILRAIFRASAADEKLQKVRLHFIGTDYAPPGREKKSIQHIAEQEGMGERCVEYPARVPYSVALKCLMDADAIVMPGSNDSGYSASKLYPCILARRPLLAVFHNNSTVHRVIDETNAGTSIAFDSNNDVDSISQQIQLAWLEPGLWSITPDTDWESFEKYTDRAMTKRLSEFLDAVRTGRNPGCDR